MITQINIHYQIKIIHSKINASKLQYVPVTDVDFIICFNCPNYTVSHWTIGCLVNNELNGLQADTVMAYSEIPSWHYLEGLRIIL
jgi:hypothetical protein